MSNEISKFFGFSSSTYNSEYQKMLNDKTQTVFGSNTAMSMTELFKNDKSIFEAYKKLDNQGLSKFEEIISLDGDSATISQAEYKTLLSVLDAEEVDKESPMLMDGKFEINDKTNGIYTLDTEKDITPLYIRIKLQNKEKTEVLKELKTEINNQLYGKDSSKLDGKNNSVSSSITDEKMAKAIFTIRDYISGAGISYPEAMKFCFGDNVSEEYDEKTWPSYTPKYVGRSYYRFLLTNLMGEPTVINVSMWGNQVDIITSNGTKSFKR